MDPSPTAASLAACLATRLLDLESSSLTVACLAAGVHDLAAATTDSSSLAVTRITACVQVLEVSSLVATLVTQTCRRWSPLICHLVTLKDCEERGLTTDSTVVVSLRRRTGARVQTRRQFF